MARRLAWLAIFLLPIPIFISPYSSVLLANSSVYDDHLSFPISFLLTPLVILAGLFNISKIKGVSLSLLVPLSLFAFWIFFLALISITTEPVAIVYAFQWLLPFIWFLYFFSSLNKYSIEWLSKPLFFGALVGALYIFLAGFLELIANGALLDSGRMTQNLILNGQYQLYVYTPTVLALSSVLLSALYRSGYLGFVSRSYFYIYLAITFFSIVFTGAREGFLVYSLGIYFIFFASTLRSAIFSVFLALLFIIIILFSWEYVVETIADYDVRLLHKISRLSEDGSAFGARDKMASLYIDLFQKDILLGFKVLPPNLAYPNAGINVKSAHNYYIDVLSWSGIPGFVLIFIFLCQLFIISLWKLTMCFLRKSNDWLGFYCAWAFLLITLVSNNINVPMRQPLTAPIAILIIYMLVRGQGWIVGNIRKS